MTWPSLMPFPCAYRRRGCRVPARHLAAGPGEVPRCLPLPAGRVWLTRQSSGPRDARKLGRDLEYPHGWQAPDYSFGCAVADDADRPPGRTDRRIFAREPRAGVITESDVEPGRRCAARLCVARAEVVEPGIRAPILRFWLSHLPGPEHDLAGGMAEAYLRLGYRSSDGAAGSARKARPVLLSGGQCHRGGCQSGAGPRRSVMPLGGGKMVMRSGREAPILTA